MISWSISRDIIKQPKANLFSGQDHLLTINNSWQWSQKPNDMCTMLENVIALLERIVNKTVICNNIVNYNECSYPLTVWWSLKMKKKNRLHVGSKWVCCDLLMPGQRPVDVMASPRANSCVVYSALHLGRTSKMFQVMWLRDY